MTMATQFTLKEILERAIQKEIGSQLLYIDLSGRMKDQASRGAFQELAQQEKTHQNLLEQYQQGKIRGVLGGGQTVDYKIAEHLYQPEISPDMQLRDVFLLAANREMHSHELYLGLAGMHPPGEAKKLLEKLASQELEHKKRVELLFTEVAFPQTDGG
jgi:rubrerythrin